MTNSCARSCWDESQETSGAPCVILVVPVLHWSAHGILLWSTNFTLHSTHPGNHPTNHIFDGQFNIKHPRKKQFSLLGFRFCERDSSHVAMMRSECVSVWEFYPSGGVILWYRCYLTHTPFKFCISYPLLNSLHRKWFLVLQDKVCKVRLVKGKYSRFTI